MRERAAAERAMVRVTTRRPAKARVTLVDRKLVPIMAQTMARVAGLMVAWMSGREGDLRVTSSPPRFNSFKNTFLVRY